MSFLSTGVILCSYPLSVLEDTEQSVLVTLRRHIGTSSKACNKNDGLECWGGRKNTDLGHEEEKESENAQMSVVEPAM